jgi:hypothetical protein
MHSLEDFVGSGSKQWEFSLVDPQNNTYPLAGILTIARNPDDTVSLAWTDAWGKDHVLPDIPFDGQFGRLHGTTLDGCIVTVTVVSPARSKIVGVIEGPFQPVAGTWGADATGGRG